MAYEEAYAAAQSSGGLHFGVGSLYLLGAVALFGFLYLLVTDTEAALRIGVALGRVLWYVVKGIIAVFEWIGRMIGKLFR